MNKYILQYSPYKSFRVKINNTKNAGYKIQLLFIFYNTKIGQYFLDQHFFSEICI